jgi:hypothetical protein
MTITVTALHPLFVGEVSGVDLRARPYDDAGHRRDMRRTTVEDTAPRRGEP